MKKFFIILAISTVALAASAGAGDTIKILGFDDVKAACLNPAQFQNQVAPTNIQVACRDVQLKWVASPDGTLSLPTAHAVVASVISDKYSVAPMAANLDSADQVLACPQYRQVSEVVDMVRAASCDELIAFTGSGFDYCRVAVEAMRESNPASIVTADTGKVVSLCSDATAAGSK